MQSLRPSLTYNIRSYIFKRFSGDLYTHRSLRDIHLKLIEEQWKVTAEFLQMVKLSNLYILKDCPE